MQKYAYFQGWYLKHQNNGQMIAFIPAYHINQAGKMTASIQVITNKGSWMIDFPAEQMLIAKKGFLVKIGRNIFSDKGIEIHLRADGLAVDGCIEYGAFRKIRGDIMGPFRFVPFLQCRHGVLSMYHSLHGNLTINGKTCVFTGGSGYIETDRGSSFPKDYLWTQCTFGPNGRGSIMISAADIPFLGKHFKGCICEVHYLGRKYRIATYLGARIKKYTDQEICLKQGSLEIRAVKSDKQPFGLQAPDEGSMTRTIYENPSCRVWYGLYRKKVKIFEFTSNQASFEKA